MAAFHALQTWRAKPRSQIVVLARISKSFASAKTLSCGLLGVTAPLVFEAILVSGQYVVRRSLVVMPLTHSLASDQMDSLLSPTKEGEVAVEQRCGTRGEPKHAAAES